MARRGSGFHKGTKRLPFLLHHEKTGEDQTDRRPGISESDDLLHLRESEAS